MRGFAMLRVLYLLSLALISDQALAADTVPIESVKAA